MVRRRRFLTRHDRIVLFAAALGGAVSGAAGTAVGWLLAHLSG
jgi:hypothetical protein